MAYQTLEKTFYRDSSSDRYANLERLAQKRKSSESSYPTGIFLGQEELFLAVPRELFSSHEQILRNETRISKLWGNLPTVALGAYIRSLVMDEVVYSNEIEGVYSTRKQIRNALDNVKSTHEPHIPFFEFAKLYLGLTQQNTQFPTTLEEIRSIYDAVVGDTIVQQDKLEAGLFRSDGVEIYGQNGKLVHEGVSAEYIRPVLRQMLNIAHSGDIPGVFSAALCHFIFEYVHPFYDGNGRTGRYLLALQLNEILSQPTALSLSRAILENRTAYYRAFTTVEKPLNHAEATPFALMLCELILQAQDSLMEDLEKKRSDIDRAHNAIFLNSTWSEREKNVLFLIAQRFLFDLQQEVSSTEVSCYLNASTAVARATLKTLASQGLLEQTRSRPLTYILSTNGAQILELASLAILT